METIETFFVSIENNMRQRADDKEKRNKILESSRNLFFARGFGAISMEEIAAQQGISKKTLYKFFPNKRALILAAVEERIAEVAARVSAVADDPQRAYLDKLREILGVVSRQLAELGPTIIKDLYYSEPEVWRRIDEFRRDFVLGVISKLLEKGTKQGFVRSDVDSRLVPLLFVNMISSLLTPAQFLSLPYSPVQLFDELVRVLFGGILSDKARRQFFVQEGKR